MLNSAVLTIGEARPSGLRPVIDLTELPPNTRGKKLAGGVRGYYWTPPSRDRERGCTMRAQALGKNKVQAILRAVKLNDELRAWRESIRHNRKDVWLRKHKNVPNGHSGGRRPRPEKLRSLGSLTFLKSAA